MLINDACSFFCAPLMSSTHSKIFLIASNQPPNTLLLILKTRFLFSTYWCMWAPASDFPQLFIENQLLQFLSNHSLQFKASTMFSKALRYNFIISENRNLQQELNYLKLSLLARGYFLEMINENIQKTTNHTRHTIIHKPKSSKKKTALTYFP